MSEYEKDVTHEFELRAIHVTKVPFFAEAELFHTICCLAFYVPLAVGSEFECLCTYLREGTVEHKRYRLVQILPTIKIIQIKG
jgi:hypothetical protein